MELQDALVQIAEIRQQMARGHIFRGYRAATSAFASLVALATGALQVQLVPNAAADPIRVIELWVTAAVVCLVITGIEMAVRTRRSASPLQRQLTLLAVEQFMPCLVAGALVTITFWEFLSQHLALLPGMWMLLFSLGIFASLRVLPGMLFLVAAFYFVMGILALMLAGRGLFFSPWLMAGTFGAGQFLAAVILYYQLERRHE